MNLTYKTTGFDEPISTVNDREESRASDGIVRVACAPLLTLAAVSPVYQVTESHSFDGMPREGTDRLRLESVANHAVAIEPAHANLSIIAPEFERKKFGLFGETRNVPGTPVDVEEKLEVFVFVGVFAHEDRAASNVDIERVERVIAEETEVVHLGPDRRRMIDGALDEFADGFATNDGSSSGVEEYLLNQLEGVEDSEDCASSGCLLALFVMRGRRCARWRHSVARDAVRVGGDVGCFGRSTVSGIICRSPHNRATQLGFIVCHGWRRGGGLRWMEGRRC